MDYLLDLHRSKMANRICVTEEEDFTQLHCRRRGYFKCGSLDFLTDTKTLFKVVQRGKNQINI